MSAGFPGNYLRVRGEYVAVALLLPRKLELPPRARRIHDLEVSSTEGSGTTSACAENTNGGDSAHKLIVELPPRARRIPHAFLQACVNTGTTSACAENTSLSPAGHHHGGNYLRVRGEYVGHQRFWLVFLELPPRARRILLPGRPSKRSRGTTSACAENTDQKP